jgi:Ca2+-binding RTX toxin-like protein
MERTPTVPGRRRWLTATALAAAGLAGVVAVANGPAEAAVQPGTSGQDVIIGRDNDNAANTFVQPAGVTAKQHLDDTDLLTGGSGPDLLMGLKGDDVLLAGSGDDILIGGNEKGVGPNSDVLTGDSGNDINIWAPGDGSDLFTGGVGYDVQVLAPFVLDGTGKPALFYQRGRQLPHVNAANQPAFRCTIDAVPAAQNLGVDYLVRFFANNNLAVTIRLKDTEKVVCPSPQPGRVTVADLTSPYPTVFSEQSLSAFSGSALGAILQAP